MDIGNLCAHDPRRRMKIFAITLFTIMFGLIPGCFDEIQVDGWPQNEDFDDIEYDAGAQDAGMFFDSGVSEGEEDE